MNDIFSIKDFCFPDDFIFGSATAGHQIEGNNINLQLWYSEKELQKDNPEYELSGMACNSYNMYAEDINILSENS